MNMDTDSLTCQFCSAPDVLSLTCGTHVWRVPPVSNSKSELGTSGDPCPMNISRYILVSKFIHFSDMFYRTKGVSNLIKFNFDKTLNVNEIKNGVEALVL
jgi:hypothetical protein